MNDPHQPEPGYPALAEDLLDRAQRAKEHWRTPGAERLGMSPHALAALAQTQHDNAAGLKRIVERLGQWPGRSTVGADACQAAVDIAVHADHDPALQRTLLGLLRRAVEAGDATSAQLAHLHDRCLVNVGQAQMYGTQHWYRPDGLLEPHPIADRAQLDTRRAGAGLPPYTEQTRRLRERHGPLASLSVSAAAEPAPLPERNAA
ncbi:hypothetical protein RI578_41245 (plasmid) [Streptomyces sp. BB1-1-1]|uniref:DUF6624 domain-containing protein n=1 Tax=Streptomyces sp. BB1-1-1 TaxID=3074430 RepID=UPI002877A8DE|nr:DUF6624 domain-containing protein [Streptomyces sp. BB1-1-1]WND40720.1 hypothetical protein RI578_41245 [Streptomyces sp. BB1-1-1]